MQTPPSTRGGGVVSKSAADRVTSVTSSTGRLLGVNAGEDGLAAATVCQLCSMGLLRMVGTRILVGANIVLARKGMMSNISTEANLVN